MHGSKSVMRSTSRESKGDRHVHDNVVRGGAHEEGTVKACQQQALVVAQGGI